MENNQFVPDENISTQQGIVDKKREKENQRKKNIMGYARDLLLMLSAALLILLLLFRVVIVSGPSMRNTLYDGDCIILLNNFLAGDPEPGDIIVASKDSFNNGEPIIKRVIAVSGQTVDIDFSTGQVFVDAVPLSEPYTLTATNLQEGVKFPVKVPEGCLFVMGDNRNNSKDSRNPEIGMIDTREVLGKAIFLVLPGANPNTGKREFDRIGVLS